MYVRKDYIQVVGKIWWPIGSLAATQIPLSGYDVENIRDEETGEITRDDIEQWLCSHSGDFSEVVDFCASIGTEEYSWANEENELIYCDCMYPSED